MNRLPYGDNLQVLREHIADESVDLIYLDAVFDELPASTEHKRDVRAQSRSGTRKSRDRAVHLAGALNFWEAGALPSSGTLPLSVFAHGS